MWRKIGKPYPLPDAPAGGYRAWKPDLAREANARCVYCCIHESKFGGARNFHVEHYRPKSLRPDLKDNYGNPFYACAICNCFKSDDWPADPVEGDLDGPGYPDPSLTDYSTFLEVERTTGLVRSHCRTGKYLIERLHLNRAQMTGLRMVLGQLDRLNAVVKLIGQFSLAGQIPSEMKDQVIDMLVNVAQLNQKISSARPYAEGETR
jgi:hypothetical protein